jgi:hypothetical protein
MIRPWREIAEEICTQPTRTPDEEERFQKLTEELLMALPRAEEALRLPRSA